MDIIEFEELYINVKFTCTQNSYDKLIKIKKLLTWYVRNDHPIILIIGD